MEMDRRQKTLKTRIFTDNAAAVGLDGRDRNGFGGFYFFFELFPEFVPRMFAQGKNYLAGIVFRINYCGLNRIACGEFRSQFTHCIEFPAENNSFGLCTDVYYDFRPVFGNYFTRNFLPAL